MRNELGLGAADRSPDPYRTSQRSTLLRIPETASGGDGVLNALKQFHDEVHDAHEEL